MEKLRQYLHHQQLYRKFKLKREFPNMARRPLPRKFIKRRVDWQLFLPRASLIYRPKLQRQLFTGKLLHRKFPLRSTLGQVDPTMGPEPQLLLIPLGAALKRSLGRKLDRGQ
jgi:hypothetical protein